MEENAWIPIIAIIATFGTMFGLVFYYLYTRNKQRIAMIEKGVDPSLFYSKPKVNKFGYLKWALLMIGIGFGFLMGGILTTYTDAEEPIFFAMILLFGGLGLLAYFFIVKNDKDGDK